MPNRGWAEKVDDQLARRGVPVKFRHRLLAELRDHADDLMDGEGLTMTEEIMNYRLGEPAALAAQASEEYRRTWWTSRHPLLVFGILPLPATLLVFAATLLVFALTSYFVGWVVAGDVEKLPRPAILIIAYAVAWGVRFVPFAILAVIFTRLYLRSRVSPWWFAAAAAQVLIVAASIISLIQYSDVPGQSQWRLGFAWEPVSTGNGWVLPFFNAVGWMQAVQVIVPVTIAAFLFRAARRRQEALTPGR